MAKSTQISGFTEWSPAERRLELQCIEAIRHTFESFGFVSVETAAVEYLETLTAKGNDKEIYTVKSLQAPLEEPAELGLHFDLTVPFARYVSSRSHELVFPFKRYQVQKVWRHDRAQKGRSREFYQFDIDTIGRDTLPLAADAEVVEALFLAYKAFAPLTFTLRVNTRKLLLGVYEALGVDASKRPALIAVVDKLDKIGPDGVTKEVVALLGAGSDVIAAELLELAGKRLTVKQFLTQGAGLTRSNELIEQGVSELRQTLCLLPAEVQKGIVVDYGLARGLNYYTGIIVEVKNDQFPSYPSCGGGGRYEDLCGQFSKEKFPGVGMSVGLTRVMELILSEKVIPLPAASPAKLFFTVLDENQRPAVLTIVRELRQQGIAVEVTLGTPKLGKQIELAEKRGIPFVGFVDATGVISVKNLGTKEQVVFTDRASLVTDLLKFME